jgi:hypothetical protein
MNPNPSIENLPSFAWSPTRVSLILDGKDLLGPQILNNLTGR